MPVKEQEIKKYKVFYVCDHCNTETKQVPLSLNTITKYAYNPEKYDKIEYFCPSCKATFWLKESYPKIVEK